MFGKTLLLNSARELVMDDVTTSPSVNAERHRVAFFPAASAIRRASPNGAAVSDANHEYHKVDVFPKVRAAVGDISGLPSKQEVLSSATTLSLTLYHKNCRGLASSERFDELFAELSHIHWDVITLNEKWREEQQEYLVTKDGHLFAAAGGVENRQGVAIIINSRWKKCVSGFTAVNERLAFLDLHLRGLHI